MNEAAVSVAGAIGSLNVAVTAALTATSVALSTGLVELTVGAVLSGAPAGLIVSANALVEEAPPVTSTVKLDVPAVVGVPLKTPAALRVNPAGGVPTVTNQLYGGVPPVAANVWLYAVPTVPAVSGLVVVIAGAAGRGSF